MNYKRLINFHFALVSFLHMLSRFCDELRTSKFMRRKQRRQKVCEHSGKLTRLRQIISLPGNDVLLHESVIFRAYIKRSRPLGFVDFAAGIIRTEEDVLNVLSTIKSLF